MNESWVPRIIAAQRLAQNLLCIMSLDSSAIRLRISDNNCSDENQITMNGAGTERNFVILGILGIFPPGKFLYSTTLLLIRFRVAKFNIVVSPVFLQAFPNFETVFRRKDRL
jgi:hypothetical protein